MSKLSQKEKDRVTKSWVEAGRPGKYVSYWWHPEWEQYGHFTSYDFHSGLPIISVDHEEFQGHCSILVPAWENPKTEFELWLEAEEAVGLPLLFQEREGLWTPSYATEDAVGSPFSTFYPEPLRVEAVLQTIALNR